MQAEIIHVGANTVLVCTLQMSTVLRVLKTPRVVLGKESPGDYSSPHTDPSAVTVLTCTGCFVLFVRVMLNSLQITPSCSHSASRTSQCQCSEG